MGQSFYNFDNFYSVILPDIIVISLSFVIIFGNLLKYIYLLHSISFAVQIVHNATLMAILYVYQIGHRDHLPTNYYSFKEKYTATKCFIIC